MGFFLEFREEVKVSFNAVNVGSLN